MNNDSDVNGVNPINAACAERPSLRAAVRAEAIKLGFCAVCAHYNGSGDEGWIESVYFFKRDDAGEAKQVTTRGEAGSFTFNGSTLTVDRGVREAMMAPLDQQFGGWENDEGSAGEIYWDLDVDRMRVTHRMRFIDYEESQVDVIADGSIVAVADGSESVVSAASSASEG